MPPGFYTPNCYMYRNAFTLTGAVYKQDASIMHGAHQPVVWKWNKHGHYELLGGSVAQGRKSEDMTNSWFDGMNVVSSVVCCLIGRIPCIRKCKEMFCLSAEEI